MAGEAGRRRQVGGNIRGVVEVKLCRTFRTFAFLQVEWEGMCRGSAWGYWVKIQLRTGQGKSGQSGWEASVGIQVKSEVAGRVECSVGDEEGCTLDIC